MSTDFCLSVVTPEGKILEERVSELTAPGALGEFGVLPGHARYMTTLDIGELCFRNSSGDQQTLAMSHGFAEINLDRVTILAQTAEMANKIDIARAELSLQRAQERMDEMEQDTDIQRAWTSLQRAMVRLQVAKAAGVATRAATIVTTATPIPGEESAGD